MGLTVRVGGLVFLIRSKSMYVQYRTIVAALFACLVTMVMADSANSASGLYDFASQYPGFGQSQNDAPQPVIMPTMSLQGNSESNSVTIAPDSVQKPDVSTNSDTSIISELRFGVFAHNAGPIASKTESGVDLNFETLFTSPDLFDAIGEPRPFAGASVNAGDDTSFLYGGLMWDFDIVGDVFSSVSLGMAVHNGNDGKETDSDGRRALGCRWLFRESVELGYRITEDIALAAFLDHVSHGGLCSDRNRGMDNSGIRLHYRL